MKHNQLVIIGYSGHSYLCVEIACSRKLNVIGYCDLEKKINNPYNLTFLGKEENISLSCKGFVAIGDNYIRKNVYNKMINKEVCLDISLIHKNSVISKTSAIREQNIISSGVIINSQVLVNKGCIINTGAIIEHECEIGEFSHICPGSVLTGGVKIGKNCFVGANSVISEGINIDDNVIIGAGSVIINDIPKNSKVVGNPGRIIKKS
ncbi:MAG: NeuD/PglB/VioB family sugar acetyltransferase [Bacteroidota bacterium]|nr:NeuD/PglB/VioB family sugar acetyltransferase [Bacteroidota bacterium]